MMLDSKGRNFTGADVLESLYPNPFSIDAFLFSLVPCRPQMPIVHRKRMLGVERPLRVTQAQISQFLALQLAQNLTILLNLQEILKVLTVAQKWTLNIVISHQQIATPMRNKIQHGCQ